MWSLQQLRQFVNRIAIRWRLALLLLGLLVILLTTLGELVLWTAEQALLTNEAHALNGEARLAASEVKGRPFTISRFPSPPPGPPPPDFQLHAAYLVGKLMSPNVYAVILSPEGKVVSSSQNIFLSPVTLPPEQVQSMLAENPQNNDYLLARDQQKSRQIVVLVPLTYQHHTVAILQLSTPTAQTDYFITSLRLTLLLSIIGALGLAAALVFPLISAALRPLVVMERASRRIAGGKLSERLDVPATDDEIGRLARSFNGMVAQLEAAFARQKQFVADVSHELRTPLTALSGSLEMLLLGADKGDIETSRQLARGMYIEVQRMHRLVEDLLALAQLDEGKLILRTAPIDIRTVVDKVYDQAQQLAHGQEIRRSIAPDVPLVHADADRLQQVLLNIMDNALKYSPATGRVELLVYKSDSASVSLEIRDTGKGIAPEALPHVFDRFYRTDPARSRTPQRAGGNGLGLAIARELIEAQGGTITIQSVPDKGTLVTIRLPAV